MKILNKLIEEIVYPEEPQMRKEGDDNTEPVIVGGDKYTPIHFRGITLLNHYRDGVVDKDDLDNAVENGLLTKTVATTESNDKSPACSYVLQGLDMDGSYSSLVNQAVEKFGVNKEELENELDRYI